MQHTHSINDYFTAPLVSRMSAAENAAHEAVIHAMIDSGKPYPLADASDPALLRNLAARNLLALAGDNVIAAYPVSGRPTNKRIRFADGREAYAMCAIDALGCHYALRENLRIESVCEACGERIVLDMHDGKIRVIAGGEHIHVLHADLNNADDWSCSCCTLMHFFACPQRLAQWRDHHAPARKTFALDLETANKTAWMLFAR